MVVVQALHDEGPLKTGDVARLFKVHISTVIDWTDKGLLPCFRTPGGQRRYRPEDVQAFLDARSEGVA